MKKLNLAGLVIATSISIGAMAACTPAPNASMNGNGGMSTGTGSNATTGSNTSTGGSLTTNTGSTSAGASFASPASTPDTTTLEPSSDTDAKSVATNDSNMVNGSSSSMETGASTDTSIAAYSVDDVAATATASGTATVAVPMTPVATPTKPAKKAKPALSDAQKIALLAAQIEKRRIAADAERKVFCKNHPAVCTNEDEVKQILSNQKWQPDPNNAAGVFKSGTATFTEDGGKVTRKASVFFEVEKAKPHHLIHAVIQYNDTYRDGATKTVNWEKSLQADGSYDITFHHEFTGPKGAEWVTDWDKTISATGQESGTGTFTHYNASGTVVSQETVTIGGFDDPTQGGETITSSGGASPSPAPSASASASASASPAASTSPAASASPTATPSAAVSASATASGTATVSH